MNRLTKLTSIMALALLLGACGKTPDKVVAVQGTDDAATQALVKDAVKQLNTACTGLNQYVYDLVKKTWSASVVNGAGNAFNYHSEKWGWNKWVEITVQVSPKAKDLPKAPQKTASASTWAYGTAETVLVIVVMAGGYRISGRLARRRTGASLPSGTPEPALAEA